MTTLLGAPIVSKGQIFGNIYLTDKIDPSSNTPLPFSSEDQRMLQMFAAQAAIAIENARLNEQNQQIAIMQERERFGMNLHDGVIQSIYALGLLLDDAQHHVTDNPELTRDRIAQSLKGLDDVIRDIRSYIMDLRPPRFAGLSLRKGLEEIAAIVSANSAVQVRLNLDAAVAGAATAQQTDELLHVTQEALANIQKHSDAKEVEIRLTRIGGRLFLTIEDNGRGFDVFRAAEHGTGNGLRNMQERARALNGEFEIESNNGKGTRIVLSVPLSSRTRAPFA
jgi:signal transduction histidine kinase